jgi:hypothetical protein
MSFRHLFIHCFFALALCITPFGCGPQTVGEGEPIEGDSSSEETD